MRRPRIAPLSYTYQELSLGHDFQNLIRWGCKGIIFGALKRVAFRGMKKEEIPNYKDLLWPTLTALVARGGSASIYELSDEIADALELPDHVLNSSHKDGPGSEVDYRAAWARTHLKYIGAIDNTARGVWTITDIGRQVENEQELRELVDKERTRQVRDRHAKRQALEDQDDDAPEDPSWEDALLVIVRKIEPEAFERLCQLVLRESGFSKVEVTGRSGDGGIDGSGVLRVNLISFHVRFQCKRYAGSVGAPEIRDFRGAMVGRADKGLFITTGGYTKEAEREAVRDGAPAIDLINGNDLCYLLRDLELGVNVTTQTVKVVTPVPEFYEKL